LGLDAVVYCDCFEKGRLQELPPSGCNVSVSDDGSLLCGSDELQIQMRFDDWWYNRACSHQDGILLHQRIGNVALVYALRVELGKTPDKFPLILSEILYSGTHAGDFLSLPTVVQLQSEVNALTHVHCDDSELETSLRNFEKQIRELVECSLHVGKPITF
jgi:hypothetical protein